MVSATSQRTSSSHSSRIRADFQDQTLYSAHLLEQSIITTPMCQALLAWNLLNEDQVTVPSLKSFKHIIAMTHNY